jgi:hypothetical protein
MYRLVQHFNTRSIALVAKLKHGQDRLILYWVALASLASSFRISSGSAADLGEWLAICAPYLLLVAAPAASFLLASRWFKDGHGLPKPSFHLLPLGRWRAVSAADARALPLYGCTGIMASLLVGILINIPVRALEFLAAMPVLSGAAPTWFGSLYTLMLADVVLLSSLYAVAFVAALRQVPLFPRLLAAIWACDVLVQLAIGKLMAAVDGLPAEVASPLGDLLEGNLKKALISVALWSPYLILSKRVNLTFRHRIPV